MILAVDVQYRTDYASVGGVAFVDWSSPNESAVYKSKFTGVKEYIPGEFFRRELPCILMLLQEHSLRPHTIVIDGFVYLDGISAPGLGKYLFDALGGQTPVVGVAKSRFAGAPDEIKVYRGGSKIPLYVTSAGIPLSNAKAHIQAMHGPHRVPLLLKKADQLSRSDD